jgi:hypothetical protein
MAMIATKKPATAAPKTIATTRPEVVRLSCRVMQEVLPSSASWQIRPGMQEMMGVLVTVVLVIMLPAASVLFKVQVIDDREVVRQARELEVLAIEVEGTELVDEEVDEEVEEEVETDV